MNVVLFDDGKRQLAKVVFTPYTPTDQFQVEVIFEVRRQDAAHLDGNFYAVVFISATRVDTRVTYICSQEQMNAAIDAAVIAVAEEDGLTLV